MEKFFRYENYCRRFKNLIYNRETFFLFWEKVVIIVSYGEKVK